MYINKGKENTTRDGLQQQPNDDEDEEAVPRGGRDPTRDSPRGEKCANSIETDGSVSRRGKKSRRFLTLRKEDPGEGGSYI